MKDADKLDKISKRLMGLLEKVRLSAAERASSSATPQAE